MTDAAPEETGEVETEAQVSLDVSAYRKILSNRGFLALWISEGISGVGDWVIVGVLLDKVNRLGGTTGLAWMMAFRFLPAFLFGLLAGAVVDRVERKTAMVFCDIARAALVFALAFANNLALICAIVFSIECFTLIHAPAKDSAIPDVVEKKDVITANSLMSTTDYLTMAMGTLIATVILAIAALIYKIFPLVHFEAMDQFQYQFAFMVDALTFVASALLIFTIRLPKRWEEKPEMSARKVFSDMYEGLRYMKENKLTRAILGGMIIGFIGGGSLYILGAPFALQVMNASGAKFTLIISVLLGGVVVGAALAPWLSRFLVKEVWFGRIVVMFGAGMIAFALSDFYVLSLVVIFFGGICLGFLLVTAYTMLHENLEDEVRGRVFAAMSTIMRTCMLFSMGIFALIARLFQIWIPWSESDPVGKTLNLGFMTKTFYPAMLALIVGGLIVTVGGIFSIRSLHRYVRDRGAGPEQETPAEVVEEVEGA